MTVKDLKKALNKIINENPSKNERASGDREMSEWIEYNGSDEQIAEMAEADSFIIKVNGVESHVMHHIDERGLLVDCDEYLICNKHKYAKLIQRWSVTGQPVHVKVENELGNHLLDVSTGFYYFDLEHSVFITTTPDWNIPGAEYSFWPFGEEK